MDHIKKFQGLLTELFQFNVADLDFGIYRIMNQKRGVIERFITEDLPKAISKELAKGALAGQTQAAKELEAAKKKVLEALGDDAIDATGKLSVNYHQTKAGKEYLVALEKAKSVKGQEALEASIYNHLYAFFNRYYQDGDFISKRRSSKRERYAIPYNGEEVTLYWANHDQYYIKTGEYFTDYTWKAPNGVTVHFKMTAADVEQNNVKGSKRFFLPCLDEIAWDESDKSLTIAFEYRPLNGQEAITYSGKNQQEAIIARTVENIPKQRVVKTALLALAALDAEKRRTADDEIVTYLEHHLRQYARRNTSDFFIHKDLKGFLSHELDFYLKNEVLNLEEMETAGVGLSEGWFQMMRLIKKVGGHIIEFLAQIEEFQKMLWEKRKFITETFYCITVGHIPEEFYPEIAVCEAQWEEWKALFSIDEGKSGKSKKDRRMAFLKAHPTLVLDTRRFLPEFTDRLLASFDDLDEATDGLLVNSENWQTLNLFAEKYKGQVACEYIDPPYNTAASEILYKNDYKHSSWLSLIINRVERAHSILSNNGILSIAIDDAEYHHLYQALLTSLGHDLVLGTVIVRSNPAGRSALSGFSVSHDYAIFYGATPSATVGEIEKTDAQISRYSEKDKNGQFEWVNFRKHGGLNANRVARPKLFYPIYATQDGHVRIPTLEWDVVNNVWTTKDRLKDGESIVWPVNEKGEEKTWKWGHTTALQDLTELTARPDRSESLGIYMKSRMREGSLPPTLWTDKKYW